MTKPPSKSLSPDQPQGYRPKRGGAQQSWFPEVTVRIAVTPEDAAFYKARMGERLAKK